VNASLLFNSPPCAKGGADVIGGGIVSHMLLIYRLLKMIALDNPSPATRELPLHKGAYKSWMLRDTSLCWGEPFSFC